MAACTPSAEISSDELNSGLVDGTTAARLFANVCGGSFPELFDYLSAVVNGQYERKTRTNSFEHLQLELGFRYKEGRRKSSCEMQFKSSDEPLYLALFIPGTVPGSGAVKINEDTGFARRHLSDSVTLTFEPAKTPAKRHSVRIDEVMQ